MKKGINKFSFLLFGTVEEIPKIYLSKSKTFLFLSTFPLLGTVFWQLVQNRQNDTRIQLFRYQKISVTICTAKYRFPETICLFTGDNLNRENK
ncbi:MAG: hypothetical protein KBF82_10885 [Chitinophagaceae bacterium]|nr:hypothetical protein [Chitinophagaceae bacterium]